MNNGSLKTTTKARVFNGGSMVILQGVHKLLFYLKLIFVEKIKCVYLILPIIIEPHI